VPDSFAPFLVFAAAICGVMAVVWAFRLRTRGVRALPMLLAFLVFGVALLWLREDANQTAMVGFGVALFVLLVMDAMLRTADTKEEE
jgi:apolipoprotein N-acyltransferase